MGAGVTLRVLEKSKCDGIARRQGSDIEDVSDLTRRSGSRPTRLSIDDAEERGTLHRPAMLLVMLAFLMGVLTLSAEEEAPFTVHNTLTILCVYLLRPTCWIIY